MQVANAQKGCCFFRTKIGGREGHSSAPEHGVNAISPLPKSSAKSAASRLRPQAGPVR